MNWTECFHPLFLSRYHLNMIGEKREAFFMITGFFVTRLCGVDWSSPLLSGSCTRRTEGPHWGSSPVEPLASWCHPHPTSSQDAAETRKIHSNHNQGNPGTTVFNNGTLAKFLLGFSPRFGLDVWIFTAFRKKKQLTKDYCSSCCWSKEQFGFASNMSNESKLKHW